MNTATAAMDSRGIMQQIREYLAGGMTSTEVISLGYRPSTVYKVQRQLDRRGQCEGRAPVTGNAEVAIATKNVLPHSQLETENARLQQEVEDLTSQLEATHDLTLELVEKEDGLEGEVRALHERVNALQIEA